MHTRATSVSQENVAAEYGFSKDLWPVGVEIGTVLLPQMSRVTLWDEKDWKVVHSLIKGLQENCVPQDVFHRVLKKAISQVRDGTGSFWTSPVDAKHRELVASKLEGLFGESLYQAGVEDGLYE